MTFISYAQNYEDVILWRAFKDIAEGFYIDVGANDPEYHSVTKAFYDAGWHGVNIEPVAAWIKKLEEHRPRDLNLQVAASNSNSTINFFEVLDTGLSTTNSESAKKYVDELGFKVVEYPVPTMPLSDICCEHQLTTVHFLKIDVEGCEFEVLQGMDFNIVRPWIILIEATSPLTQDDIHDDWEQLIINHNYHFTYFDGLNRFYVVNEHQELDSCFTTPPNVWDQFQTAQEQTLTKLIHQQQTSIHTLNTEIQRLNKEYQSLNTSYQSLNTSYQALDEGYKALDKKHQALDTGYKELDEKHQALDMELNAIRESLWWWVTTPLRFVTNKLKS